MDPRSLTVELSGLSTAIHWLREHDVSSNRLAAVLGTTAGHVRVLNHRGKQQLRFNPPPADLNMLLSRSADQLRHRLRVRKATEVPAYSDKAIRRIDDLEAELYKSWAQYAAKGDFIGGLEALKPFRIRVGRPGSPEWLRFSAQLCQHSAWFHTHTGMSTTAFQEAKVAIDLSQIAYHDTEDPLDLRRLTESCLIASNACRLGADPRSSLALLDLASEASARISDPLGSEHYRQRAAALLQLFEDEAARKCLEKARPAMLEKNEARNPAQLAMVDRRHRALLESSDLDELVELIPMVRRDFPPASLELAMTLNSAAASALLTDSTANHQLAAEYLVESSRISISYLHQATISILLALTPDLGLARRFWPAWIRRALYENAYKTE